MLDNMLAISHWIFMLVGLLGTFYVTVRIWTLKKNKWLNALMVLYLISFLIQVIRMILGETSFTWSNLIWIFIIYSLWGEQDE